MDENLSKQNNSNRSVPGIRTYGSDMADAIRTNEASVIKIALAEQKKREREELYIVSEGTKTSRVFLVIGGIILIVFAILGILFVVKQKANQSLPQEIKKEIPSIVSYDETQFADTTSITGKEIIASGITKDISDNGTLNKVRALFLTKQIDGTQHILTREEFMELLEMRAPQSLLVSLGRQYMIGTYTLPEKDEIGESINKQHLFMLLQTKDFNQTYASMLEWEKTMLDDMYLLFSIDVSDRQIFETPFKDIIIANKDARVLEKQNGTPLLYYMFLNKETFIITDNKEVIKEVGARLLTKGAKPL